MAAKASKRKLPSFTPNQKIEVRVSLRVTDDTPSYYVNHLEVSQTQHEFTFSVGKIPSRFSAEKQSEIAGSHVMEIDAMLQLMIPPTLLPGIIKAMQIQLELFEKANGKVKDNSGLSVEGPNERLN